MTAIIYLIVTIIDIYQFILIASVIFSWLIAFNVINTYNRFVAIVVDVLNRLTEPVLRPLRNILPSMGGLDLSPLVALLLLYFLKILILRDIAPALGVYRGTDRFARICTDLSNSRVTVVSGATSREKRVLLSGDQALLATRLRSWFNKEFPSP